MRSDTDTDTDTDTALLVIDNEPIRRELESELTAIRGAIEECEAEIARHESLDLPAFRQWMAVQCSDLLNERRSIEEKIWRLRARLSAIQGLTRHGIKNVAAAFFWFQEIEQDRMAIPPYVRRAWEEVIVGPAGSPRAHEAESGRSDAGSEDGEDETYADWSVGGTSDEMFFDRGELEPEDREEGSRHKSLYRKIALLLHPDLAGALSKQELELWYQAQRAYEERDIVALETILARCDRVGTNSLTFSELRGLLLQANSRRATLRQSIDLLAQLPSWRFLLLSSSEVRTRLTGVRRELEGVIRGLSHEVTMMEEELARIGARAEQWMRRRQEEGRQLALGI